RASAQCGYDDARRGRDERYPRSADMTNDIRAARGTTTRSADRMPSPGSERSRIRAARIGCRRLATNEVASAQRGYDERYPRSVGHDDTRCRSDVSPANEVESAQRGSDAVALRRTEFNPHS